MTEPLQPLEDDIEHIEEDPIGDDDPVVPPPDDFAPPPVLEPETEPAAAAAPDEAPVSPEAWSEDLASAPVNRPAAESGPSDLYNLEAEKSVLGAILLDQEAYYEASEVLRPDDFYLERHRLIWEAIQDIKSQNGQADIVTISALLEEKGQLETVERSYLASLISTVPSALHVSHYARLVEAASIRRRMVQAANEIARLAYNQKLSVDRVLTEAEKQVFNVSERRLTNYIQPIDRVLSDYYDRLEELARRDEEITGVPTGFRDLDKLLVGLQPSDLIIIAGRPGQGKTGLLLNIARNAALHHKRHVAIFSLEMSNEQLVQRLIAQQTGIDSQRLRTGKLRDDEWTRLAQAIEQFNHTKIFLDDTPAITPLQLRSKCRRLHMEHGLDLVIIDYLQLMGGDTRTDNRVQEVSYISRNLKVLARELNVPVIAAAQLSRAVEQRTDKRPQLSDLRESGSLEQDADIVMFIYRDEYYHEDSEKKGVAEIIIGKHRNGPTGTVELVFVKEHTLFRDAVKKTTTFDQNFETRG